MSGYERQVATVERFMSRVACLRDTDNPRDQGNLAIAFIAKPRRFKIQVMAQSESYEGEGSTLLEAIRALTQSVERGV